MLKRYPKYFISIVAIFFVFVTSYIYFTSSSNGMTVSFLDVGQGDAVLITAPNGNRLLYDSGPPDNIVLSAIQKELPSFGKKINIFVASHPDADHIGGFSDLLKEIKPNIYLDAHTLTLSSLFVGLEESLSINKIERRTIKRGTVIKLGGGVVIDVLNPVLDDRKDSLTTNDSSASLLVSYGKTSILLTGDLEEKEETRLAKYYKDRLHATILKAGHHGSKSSTGDLFLKTVNPEFVVISVGKNNKYGHPHASTLSRIKLIGAEVFETSKEGSIKFNCNTEKCLKI